VSRYEPWGVSRRLCRQVPLNAGLIANGCFGSEAAVQNQPRDHPDGEIPDEPLKPTGTELRRAIPSQFQASRDGARGLLRSVVDMELTQIPGMACIVPQMESSAGNPPLNLLNLYKSREVNRISTFADVAGQFDPGDLVAAYARTRESASRVDSYGPARLLDGIFGASECWGMVADARQAFDEN
jgi:hypothetical protein